MLKVKQPIHNKQMIYQLKRLSTRTLNLLWVVIRYGDYDLFHKKIFHTVISTFWVNN